MKLDLRIALPAALVAAAIAIPISASADPPHMLQCPDGYLLVPSVGAPEKDRNENGVVCMKITNGSTPVHDDTCNCDHLPLSTNPEDYLDDTII